MDAALIAALLAVVALLLDAWVWLGDGRVYHRDVRVLPLPEWGFEGKRCNHPFAPPGPVDLVYGRMGDAKVLG